MHISQMKDSKFLKKEDCGKGILVTIKSIHEENVAVASAPPEMKWCLAFHEHEKPMVVNSTNLQLIAAFLGEETDNWIGKKIVLYSDPNVSYQGRLIGGIRCRAPRNVPQNQPMNQGPPPRPAPEAVTPTIMASSDTVARIRAEVQRFGLDANEILKPYRPKHNFSELTEAEGQAVLAKIRPEPAARAEPQYDREPGCEADDQIPF